MKLNAILKKSQRSHFEPEIVNFKMKIFINVF